MPDKSKTKSRSTQRREGEFQKRVEADPTMDEPATAKDPFALPQDEQAAEGVPPRDDIVDTTERYVAICKNTRCSDFSRPLTDGVCSNCGYPAVGS